MFQVETLELHRDVSRCIFKRVGECCVRYVCCWCWQYGSSEMVAKVRHHAYRYEFMDYVTVLIPKYRVCYVILLCKFLENI
jgi:hypothetical protein